MKYEILGLYPAENAKFGSQTVLTVAIYIYYIILPSATQMMILVIKES